MKNKPLKCRVRGCQGIRKPLARACSMACALKLAKMDREKKQKAERVLTRAEKLAMRTRGEWLRLAQKAFNSYIRARDYGLACISSGKPMDWDRRGYLHQHYVDAGHYRSIGSAPHLRFNTYNAHAQSVSDNKYLSGSAVDYRINLIKKIGLDKVERLESDNEKRTFNIQYLKRIKRIFTKRAKMVRRRKGL